MHPLRHLKLGRVALEVSLAQCALIQKDILYWNFSLSRLFKNKGKFLKPSHISDLDSSETRSVLAEMVVNVVEMYKCS